MSASRLAVVAIALGFAIVGAIVFRTCRPQPSTFADEAAARSASSPRTRTDAKPVADGLARERQETSRGAGAMPAEAGAPQRSAARSHARDEPYEGPAGGSEITAFDQAVAARRRDEVVRRMPEPRDRHHGSSRSDDDATVPDGFPAGTRFAAKLNGTATAIDGSEPIVEKNTEHDGNDGIYFPPDAQLAYPNRAGVHGDAGTVALWVEPVDWDGKDANVNSFFRLNDPSDGGYRFHLLKDAATLRFQFITDQGESNIRVPIDWWPRGEGHHIAATWDSNVLTVYVDGVALAEQPYEGTLQVPPGVPGWWGSKAEAGTPGAGAVLRETLVTDRPLAEAEIQGLFEKQ